MDLTGNFSCFTALRLQLLIDSLPCFTSLIQGYLPLQEGMLTVPWVVAGVGWEKGSIQSLCSVSVRLVQVV
jgi:hypothetical protein